jgi:hypothetical protein
MADLIDRLLSREVKPQRGYLLAYLKISALT